MNMTQPIYFVQRTVRGWEVRENHEVLFGIQGGSGSVKTFDAKWKADASAKFRNDSVAVHGYEIPAC
jgi:hypothetical protein